MRKKPFFCLVLLFVLLLSLPGFSRADDAKIQAYKDAIKANPNDHVAHFNLGVSYYNQSQYDLAVPEFQNCLRLDSGDSQARELLEMCQGLSACYEKNDCSTAISHFQNVLKINPSNKDILLPLYQCQAKIAMDQKNVIFKDAETPLLKILDLHVKNDQVNFKALENLGVINFQQKQYKEAVDYWEKAIQLQNDAKILKFLGFSYYNLGSFKQAIEYYKKSIELETSKPAGEQDASSLAETYYNLGAAYDDNSLYDEAVTAFDEAFKLNPKDSTAALNKADAIGAAINAHMDRANGFLLNNQYSDAIAEWQKVLGYQPDNKQVGDFITDSKKKLESEVEKHYQAGKEFANAGKNLKALNEWNSALEMDPANEKVKKAIANTRTKAGEQVSALLSEGNNLASDKDYVGALSKYQMAEKVSPNDKSVQTKIKKLKAVQSADLEKKLSQGKKDLKKGNLKDALSDMEAAYRVDPSDPDVKESLFQVKKDIRNKVDSLLEKAADLLASGDKASAKAKAESVIALDPNNEKANDLIQQMTGKQAQEKVDADKVKELYYEGVNNYINGNIREAIAKWDECLKLDSTNVNAKNDKLKAMAKLQQIESLSQQ
jgi:superkiller protein 3